MKYGHKLSSAYTTFIGNLSKKGCITYDTVSQNSQCKGRGNKCYIIWKTFTHGTCTFELDEALPKGQIRLGQSGQYVLCALITTNMVSETDSCNMMVRLNLSDEVLLIRVLFRYKGGVCDVHVVE